MGSGMSPPLTLICICLRKALMASFLVHHGFRRERECKEKASQLVCAMPTSAVPAWQLRLQLSTLQPRLRDGAMMLTLRTMAHPHLHQNHCCCCCCCCHPRRCHCHHCLPMMHCASACACVEVAQQRCRVSVGLTVQQHNVLHLRSTLRTSRVSGACWCVCAA